MNVLSRNRVKRSCPDARPDLDMLRRTSQHIQISCRTGVGLCRLRQEFAAIDLSADGVPETCDTPNLTGSVIAARDIEELEGAVFPWQLDMRQVSKGTMDARIRLGEVGGILATRAHWSRKVVAVGATPAVYLALAGSASEKSFKYCGHEIDSRQVACGLDGTDIDFATPQLEDHWVLLIPQKLLVDYLGERTMAALRGRRVLRCEPNLSSRLFSLANRAVDSRLSSHGPFLERHSTKALRADLLEAAAQLVTGSDGNRRDSGRRRRYRACCRAIAYSKRLREPIGVQDMARIVGVSRRTLERAFAETLGISPYRYLRLHRLNRLHRELRSAHPGERSVTAMLSEWGFSELGRTAVEYKRLFGESPSVTLAERPVSPSLKLADALIAAQSSTFTDLLDPGCRVENSRSYSLEGGQLGEKRVRSWHQTGHQPSFNRRDALGHPIPSTREIHWRSHESSLVRTARPPL